MIRRNDVVSGAADLEHLKTYYDVPVFQGCTDEDPSTDEFADLEFAISRGTGMIQMRQLLSLDKVYHKSHFSGTVGKIWADHHSEFCDFVQKYSSKKILEIGGGHGTLSSHYLKKFPDADWTIIDPLTTLPEDSTVKVINEFFSDTTVIDPDVDTITHSHFLEHVYEPSLFFDHLSTLPVGTRMIFSVPNIEKHFFDFRYISSITFEHSYMCSEPYIQYWLKANGYALIEKRLFGDDHSIFFAALKIKTKAVVDMSVVEVPNHYNRNEYNANGYFRHYEDLIWHLNQQLPPDYFIFGANPPTQFLVSQGLKSGAECVLDNDVIKQGKRLYGTNLRVKSPEILRYDPYPVVVLTDSPYSEEIKKGILTINPNTSFLG